MQDYLQFLEDNEYKYKIVDEGIMIFLDEKHSDKIEKYFKEHPRIERVPIRNGKIPNVKDYWGQPHILMRFK